MTQPVRQRGAGMGIVPEYLVRELLVNGLQKLAGDSHRLAELYARADTLRQGTQEQWLQDMRNGLLALAKTDGANPLRVIVGYPGGNTVLPAISIVQDTGGERTESATAADLLHVSYEQTGVPSATVPGDSRVVRHRVEGNDWTTTLQIGSWALSGEQSVLIHTAVRHLLFFHKADLAVGGVYEVALSESGFAPDPGQYPRTHYVPFVRCTLDWTWRHTRREGPYPTRVAIRTSTITN